ncbi:MAG: hypothetical protein IKN16_12335 [Selenomonadaceae bacterium]|nr:hypothetical protein [Selenomonadaceae bacterium]MBR6889210.1 hypothetical protein [Selenomonadaceae bacterium]
MNGSLLRVFSLECNDEFRTISPHVRYISPDNVLNDLYRIINCERVTCTEIQVNGKLFDVWSDDEALLKNNPAPNLYIDNDFIIFGSVVFAKSDEDGGFVGLEREEVHLLWNFAQAQFPKLLNFIARQRR